MSISWGMLPQKFMAACGTKVTVTVWEDASKPIEETEWFEFKLKRITFKIVKNDFCDLNHNSPIICARPVNENQTLSKVSIIFSDSKKIYIMYYQLQSQETTTILYVLPHFRITLGHR